MASRLEKISRSPDETLALGERIGRAAKPGDVVALYGDLGAGKTVLVKGIMRGLGGDPNEIVSPTFVLMLRHDARLPLYHFDAYRLSGATEMLELGAEEAYYGNGIAIVEWADRVGDSLPPERLDIGLRVRAENERTVDLQGVGPRGEALLARMDEVIAPDSHRDNLAYNGGGR